MTKELFDTPIARTNENIRALLCEMDRASVSEIAQAAIYRGLIAEEVLARCQMSGVESLVRKALKATTPAGLPFAKPIDGNLWARWNVLTREECFGVIERERLSLGADWTKLKRLCDDCVLRFGAAPELPDFSLIGEPVEAP